MRRLVLTAGAVALLAALLLAAANERRAHFRIPFWLASSGEESAPAAIEPKDLSVSLGGAPTRVLSVNGPGDDLLVLLVLDLTEYLELADSARQALVAEVERLPARTRVGLLRSQDGLRVLVDPTHERASVAETIRAVPVSGKAGLLESVETMETIADAILAKANVRVAVLYVTDSDVGNYREDFTNPVINSSDSGDLSRRFPEQIIQERIARVEANLAGRQAPLFIVHLNYRNDRLNEAYQVGLRRLAEITGGAAEFCRSVVEIPNAIQKSFELIASHYSVSLEVPDRSLKSVEIQLGLADGRGGRSLNYRTRFALR
jgi:hypothetical protein